MFWVTEMNKSIYIAYSFVNSSGLFVVLCALFFVFGSAAGAIIGQNVAEAELISRIFGLSANIEVNLSLIYTAFFDNAVWAVIFLFCAFSAFGIIGAALAVVLKSGLISFASCVFIRIFGADGILFSLLFFSAELILLLPAFLLLAANSLETSVFVAKLCFSRFGTAESFRVKYLVLHFVFFIVLSAAVALIKCFVIYPVALSAFPA